MTSLSRLLAGAVVAGLAATTAGVAQESVPASGEFSLRYTLVNPTTSSFGLVARSEDAGHAAGAGGWLSWLMDTTGNSGFGHKMTGRCAMFYRASSAGYDLVVGDCVYSDADGDKLFESFDGLAGAWTGGTGKYAGIKGALELTDITVTGESGYEMISGVKVGSYTIE